MSLDRHFKQGPMFGCSDTRCCGVYPPEDTDHCPECMVEWPCEVELLRQRAERAEAQCVALRNEVDSADRRAERAEAELAFQRKWCADNLGLMPPTREQNDAFLAALDGDQQ